MKNESLGIKRRKTNPQMFPLTIDALSNWKNNFWFNY